MASVDKAELSRLYGKLSELTAQGNDDLWKSIVQICDEILKFGLESGREALHCKLVALLRADRFADVIAALGGLAAEVRSELLFEEAYAHYRLNNNGECLALLESSAASNSTLPILHLRAQLYYRLGRYSDALDCYNRLLTLNPNSEDLTAVNAVANAAQARQIQKAFSICFRDIMHDGDYAAHIKTIPSYELAFNTAFAALRDGNYKLASSLLDHAEQSGREFLSEEMSPEEVESELICIQAQRGFLHSMTGATTDAERIYSDVLKRKDIDAQIAVVASNNMSALAKSKDVSDAFRKAKPLFTDENLGKLTVEQKRIVLLNRGVLSIQLHKEDQLKDVLKKVSEDKTFSDLDPILTAASLFRHKKYQECESTIRSFLHSTNASSASTSSTSSSSSSSSSLSQSNQSISLILARILLIEQKYSEAAEILSQIGSLRHRPAMISLLVHLWTISGSGADVNRLCSTLTDSLSYYENLEKDSVAQVLYRQLLLFAGDVFQRNHRFPEAVKAFDRLSLLDPGNVEFTARLILALSHVDIKRAESLMASISIPSLESLGKSITELENLKLSNSDRLQYRKRTVPVADGDVIRKKDKKRRKKKVHPDRLKNYDAAKTPDPDRWLSKRERQAKLVKSKDRRSRMDFRGPQGATQDVDLSGERPSAQPAPAKDAQVAARLQAMGARARRR